MYWAYDNSTYHVHWMFNVNYYYYCAIKCDALRLTSKSPPINHYVGTLALASYLRVDRQPYKNEYKFLKSVWIRSKKNARMLSCIRMSRSISLVIEFVNFHIIQFIDQNKTKKLNKFLNNADSPKLLNEQSMHKEENPFRFASHFFVYFFFWILQCLLFSIWAFIASLNPLNVLILLTYVACVSIWTAGRPFSFNGFSSFFFTKTTACAPIHKSSQRTI